MSKKSHRARRASEPRSFEAARSFEDSRTIDVTDRQAMRFWSDRLGVPETEIAEAVREVGPNSTAVALKLEAPYAEGVVSPSSTPR
jgi:hypothetical protein